MAQSAQSAAAAHAPVVRLPTEQRTEPYETTISRPPCWSYRLGASFSPVFATQLAAQAPEARAAEYLDQLWRATGVLSITVAVAHQQRIVFSEGIGFADLDNLVPASPQRRQRPPVCESLRVGEGIQRVPHPVCWGRARRRCHGERRRGRSGDKKSLGLCRFLPRSASS